MSACRLGHFLVLADIIFGYWGSIIGTVNNWLDLLMPEFVEDEMKKLGFEECVEFKGNYVESKGNYIENQ